MAEVNKNFRVKNGLEVSGNGTFNGTVTANDPTSSNHLATKNYVDSEISAVTSQSGNLPTGGLAGQILSKIDSVDYNTQWIDNYAAQVKHLVTAGAYITKGQAVYVSGANGTNMIVSKASNASEMTSSKTFGLVQQDMLLNDQGYVITEGLLSGLDTSAATVGDLVWLGTDGNLLYGLANKPIAPAHLVFIGIVTRVNANNGEIFVKIQNGFELNEIHNVLLDADASIADNEVLAFDTASSLWKNQTADEANIVDKTSDQTITANKTFTGAQTLVSSATNVVPLTVTGVSGQASNLLELYTTTNLQARIGSVGNAYVRSMAVGSTSVLGVLTAYPASTQVGQVIRLATSQTADAFQVQNSAGTNLLTISPSGRLTTGIIQSTFQMIASTTSASTVPLIARGGSSQTADLFQIQDSSSTVLSNVDSVGRLNIGANNFEGSVSDSALRIEARGTAGTQRPYIELQGVYANDAGNENGGALIRFRTSRTEGYGADIGAIRGSLGQSTLLFKTQDGSGSPNIVTKMQISPTGNVFINGFTSATVGLTIKAAASQTANLQEWQDSAGSVHSGIQSNGYLWVGGASSPGGQIGIATEGPGNRGLVIKGSLSQSANLQEWQNSTGETLAIVSASGALTVKNADNSLNVSLTNNNVTFKRDSTSYLTSVTAGGTLTHNVTAITSGDTHVWNSSVNGFYINPSLHLSASAVPLTVRGSLDQTANLQEWKDSAGTVKARISSNGAIVGAAGLIVTGAPTTIGATSNPGSQLAVIATSTSIPTILIKSIVSQTSNLEEWQDSTGSVLASMSASGVFSAVSKSFVIDHPTKPGKKLRYGSLEGPENGVYVRGQVSSNIIELPEYWTELVDENSITVNITSIGKSRKVFVKEVKDNKIFLGGRNINCYYTVFAERKDVDRLVVEE